MILSPETEANTESLSAFQKHQITNTKVENDLLGIVEIASQVCDAPIAFIHLTDEKMRWIKARKGIEDSRNLDYGFCEQTTRGDDIFIVNDTLKDERFSNNPLVTSYPNVRFYAGIPLVTDSGEKLGALCVMDQKPKSFNERQQMDLHIMAGHVVNLLDFRLRNLQLQNLVKDKTSEFSNFLDRIGDAFIALDKNWNYTYVNRQLGELIHRDPSELIGKNVWKEFPEAVNSATYHAFHKAMKEQQYICHIDYFKPLNLWQENHIYPTPEGISVFIRDISERKRAEMKLVENIETLQRAEEQAKMGSWRLDLVSGRRFWSKQLFLMFGFDPGGEIPTRGQLLERIHPEDRASYLMSIDKMSRGLDPGDSVIRTNPLVLPLRYMLGYIRQIKDERGNTIRFEGTMIDVTELQKTNYELDQFVYSVSHDLRSPLSTILGLLNLAELENHDPGVVLHLTRIRDQVNRLDYFIREILDYFTNARSEAQHEKVEFQKLVDEIKNNLRPAEQSCPVQVNVDISEGSEFYSDYARLEIILKNLFSNSIKYQDFNKESCSINIRILVTQSQAKIAYSDNGIGIERIHLPKIFDMFYRAHPNSKGAGLGLYIVREAIHKLGGTIRVDSEVGAHTTFEMTLPNFLSSEK